MALNTIGCGCWLMIGQERRGMFITQRDKGCVKLTHVVTKPIRENGDISFSVHGQNALFC